MARVVIVLAIVIAFVASLLYRPLFDPRFTKAAAAVSYPLLDPKTLPFSESHVELVQVLSQALRIPTIGFETPTEEQRQSHLDGIHGIHKLLRTSFPRVFSALEVELVNDLSFLMKWGGSDNTRLPILLMSHMDVVPVDTDKWTRDPFGGEIIDGWVWGRGAIDDKMGVVAILTAVDRLLASGFAPQRSVYIAFGHDEETLNSGARATVEVLRQRGVHFEFVIDEGPMIVTGVLPVKEPIALIGVAEKGYLNLDVTVNASLAGHSSMPLKHSAVTCLGRALAALEDAQMDTDIETLESTLDALVPYMGFGHKILFANMWLFRPLVRYILLQDNAVAASIRTTFAFTMLKAGQKINVMPGSATASINSRVHPTNNHDDVKAHVMQKVKQSVDANCPGVEVNVRTYSYSAPSRVSAYDSFGFKTIAKTVIQVSDAVGGIRPIVAPNLMIGKTDSYYYDSIANDVYRFSAIRLTKSELSMFHGDNERIALPVYAELVSFFYQLVVNAA